MSEVSLPALSGRNPLGYLAALGVLDVLDRAGAPVRLSWSEGLVPTAMLSGVSDVDEVVAAVDADRPRWLAGAVLGWPLDDVKPGPAELDEWARAVADADPADVALWSALLAQGGFDRSTGMKGKPTHLHFTAGRQKFLVMARSLAQQVTATDVQEAVVGPWRYGSELPSFSWDSQGERVYALRGSDPAKEKRLANPGADWLALLGLRFYPVTVERGRLRTSACDDDWKRSAFRWPIWTPPLSAAVVTSLVADASLVGPGARRHRADLRARGVRAVLSAPIRRSDQGGYGSFGAPDVLVEA